MLCKSKEVTVQHSLSTSSLDSASNVGLFSPLDCLVAGQGLAFLPRTSRALYRQWQARPLQPLILPSWWEEAEPPPAFDPVQLVGRKGWSLSWRHPEKSGLRGSHRREGADQLDLTGRTWGCSPPHSAQRRPRNFLRACPLGHSSSPGLQAGLSGDWDVDLC